jgi:hypothetical protein
MNPPEKQSSIMNRHCHWFGTSDDRGAKIARTRKVNAPPPKPKYLDDGTTLIPLSGDWGEGQYAIVDTNHHMAAKVMRYRWYLRPDKRGVRIVRTSLRMRNQVSNVSLAAIICGASTSEDVKHKNGNALDCRRKNLARQSL